MAVRKILVPIFQDVPFRGQLEAALQLGRREPVHIDAVFIRPEAAQVAASMPAMLIAAGITVENLEQEGHEAEAAAKAEFELWREENDVPLGDGDLNVSNANWHERVMPVELAIAGMGRLSDLIVVVRPDAGHEVTQRAFDVAVFDTARPTLVLSDEVPADLLDHLLIAWNSSIEATRVVAGALPLLSQANHVSIFTAAKDSGDAIRNLYLGEQLAWHGIRSHTVHPATATKSVGESLLEAAAYERATMIVMGAYTHSRVREMLLGGVTRHVLRHANVPVLMMH